MQSQSRSSSIKSQIIFTTCGVILLALGIVSLVGFGAMLHISCYRTDAATTCRSHVSFMGIIPLGVEQIHSDVRRAEMVESCTDNGERFLCAYGVDVISADGLYQLNSHFFSEPSARELVDDLNLLKEAPANGPVLRRNIQNRSMLGLGWLCVSAPFLILGVLFISAGIRNGQPENTR